MGYHVPRTMDDLWPALAGGAEVIAGGTDWFPAAGDHVGGVDLVDVTGLTEFAGIAAGPDGWRIGAAVTWSEIFSADLPACFDGLKAAAREVGSVQIQNVGTLAGNICNASPAADGVPPLLALGASVECVSSEGTRVLPLDSFLLGPRHTALRPGEVVAALLVPPQPTGAVAAFSKAGARAYLVISIAMIAVQACVVAGRLSDVRIAVGSCGPVAMRLTELEARLQGAAEVSISADDLASLSPIDDVRGSAAYRIEVVSETLTRVLRGML